MGDKTAITGFEGCTLPSALEVMGERWSFLILRAAMDGIVHFDDFQSNLGIARNILSNRLGRLVCHGILLREPVAEDKRKVAYRLTQKGKELLPAMIALRQWGAKWGGGRIPASPVLADRFNREPIRNIAILSADGRVLDLDDLCWVETTATPADCEPGPEGRA
jgi:DNA-binding HxlR family transcriptional regulator